LTAAWDRARQEILSNANLFQLGTKLGLGAVIFTSAAHYGPPGLNMIATTFEALFGAIYKDGGDAAVTAVIEHLGLDNHPSLMVTVKPFFCTPISEPVIDMDGRISYPSRISMDINRRGDVIE
jgi:hypothetical protein